MGNKLKKKDNFLEFVPEKNPDIEWEEDDEGNIKLIIKRDKWLEKIMRPITKSPKTMKIDLEEIGSFVWKEIDGKSSIIEIGKELEKKFDNQVRPVYERLSTYINILRNNKFIILKKS